MATAESLANRVSRFVRVAGWSQRHAVLAVLLWTGVLIAVTVAAQLAGTRYHNDISLPGTESQQLLDRMRAHAPDVSGDSVTVVMRSDAGLVAPGTKASVEAMLAHLRVLDSVAAVSDPYQVPAGLSADGRIGAATVTLEGQTADVPVQDVRAIIDTARAAARNGLTVEIAGDAVGAAEGGSGGPAEGAGILAALVILVLLFGSLLAASLPLITALFAVGTTIGLTMLASHLTEVASYTTPLMVLVGLGVGIDYGLLVFSRYRSELLAGAAPDVATRRALDTAGRAVLFAGATVIIALLGLLALGLGSLHSVALAVAATVLVTVLAALTLLPALLTLFGRRIDRRIRGRAKRTSRPPGERWRRWASRVERRPVLPASAGIGVLLILAAPALDLRLGIADAGTDPQTQTTRRAYDLLAEGFGPGSNGPLILLVEGSAQAAVDARTAISTTPGVASATPPQPTTDGQAWLLFVIPDSAPQDQATTELVTRLRHDVLPPLAAQTGATYLVGGSPAAAGNFAAAVSSRLPLFVLVVIGLSALLLMAVFRSLLIPIKAAVLNLLSIGACLGVITIVFQRGLFGAQPAPVEAFLPVTIFAIVFGLSMDYEIFLLARTHEEWRRTGDPDEAVREGLAATGGVITAAAAIMVVVFSSFLLSPDRMLREFGLGLAVAVLVDAVIIRCLVVPAVMRLLGRRAWWLPAPLDRLLPGVPLEPAGTGRLLVTAQQTRRWLPVVLALAVAVPVALAVVSWNRSATNTVGAVEFGRPLAIPPLASSHLDDRGRRVFDLTLQRGSTDLGRVAATPTRGINGGYLGPTLRAARGETVLINVHNEVGEATTLHWHGMHLPARMDGGPHQMIEPGTTWSPTWTISQPAATLWYHPHLHGKTAEHVARGLAGMFIVDDDRAARELSLPDEYGVDDIPVIVQDRSFRNDGRFDDRAQQLSNTGQLGDTLVVNGTVNPFLQVITERVRLRLLNASNARIYNFGLDDDREFAVIGTDGGLLARPSPLRRIELSPGERAEIVVTVSPGERTVLRSFASELGAGFLANRLAGGDDTFDVLELRAAQELSPSGTLPGRLAEPPDPDPSIAVATRTFQLGDSEINGRTMDLSRVDIEVTVGTSEIWRVTNVDGSPHSFHVHDVQFRILDRDGTPPPADLAGPKDTVYVAPETSVRLLLSFTDYTDPLWPYMFHCHLLRHEDQGMMGQFVVVKPGERAAAQLGTITPKDSSDGTPDPMTGHHH